MTYRREVSTNYLIDKFKHGNKLLSHVKRSPSPHHLMAATLGLSMGIAAFYLALLNGIRLPWLSQGKDSSEIVCYIGGLQNLGNNCFLNVILQALASCCSFLPFLKSVLETDHIPFVEKAERMPLIYVLSSLLEDLSIIRDDKTVLNPRRVMHALSFYVSNFNLTRQQDAAEAFLHLLSSLKSEISLSYVPHGSSLANIITSPSRIYNLKTGVIPECEQWKQNLFGPFDGTIGSILTCGSCSSTISLDFEHFDSLPLSPVLDGNDDIVVNCSLVDSLHHFTAVEHLESFRCDRCWHFAAASYLSRKSEMDEEKLNRLSSCVNYDSCCCRNLFLQNEITWSGFSHASKQLLITRCPNILCIQLQRAVMNLSGEFIKHQGHISFPLYLDLSPFTDATFILGEGRSSENIHKQWMRHQGLVVPPVHSNKQRNMLMFPHICTAIERTTSVQESSENNSSNCCSGTIPGNNSESAAYKSKARGSDAEPENICSPRSYMYMLSCVVEHYGRYGGGHYAAYRRAPPDSRDVELVHPMVSKSHDWFYVSDREVSSVSEETVLAAEASLLFYERIPLLESAASFL